MKLYIISERCIANSSLYIQFPSKLYPLTAFPLYINNDLFHSFDYHIFPIHVEPLHIVKYSACGITLLFCSFRYV